MKSISSTRGRTIGRASAIALFALASAVSFATTAHAQSTDSRFRAWIGCWVPDNTPTPAVYPLPEANGLVCVVPDKAGTGVRIVSASNGRLARVEAIDATGEKIAKSLDGCPGWESGSWSADGHRLFLRSEFTCTGNTTITGSSIMAMNSVGQWIQIEGTNVGKTSSAAAVHFHLTGVELDLGANQLLVDSMPLRTRTVATGVATYAFRMAAGASVEPEDVLDASRHVDRAVAEAWITELDQKFEVNSKTLVAMADQGMPSTMIDLLVALSYPDRFAVRANRGDTTTVRSNRGYATRYGYGSYGYDPGYYGYGFGIIDSYGSCGYSPYGSYYGNYFGGYYDRGVYGGRGCGANYNPGTYYFGSTPVIIYTRGSEPQTQRGRAVAGKGYTRSSGSASSSGYTRSEAEQSSRRAASETGSSSGSSSSSSGSSSGSSGSSSGGGGGRTAKARGPG